LTDERSERSIIALFQMKNETIKIITSEQGKDLALVGTKKYSFIRQRKDGQVKWLCTNRTCYASILSESGRSKVLSMLGKHRHINTMEKIEHRILQENCKRKADYMLLNQKLDF